MGIGSWASAPEGEPSNGERMTGGLRGWQPDPFGIHELRYFSADGEPTRLVRDNNRESYDEPPVASPHVHPSIDRIAATDDSLHSPAGPGAPEPVAPVAPVATPAGWFPDPTNSKQQRYWDGQGWTEYRSLTASFLSPAKARSERALRIAVTAAAMLVVAGLIGLVVTSGSRNSPAGSAVDQSLGITTTTQPIAEPQSSTAASAPIASVSTTRAISPFFTPDQATHASSPATTIPTVLPDSPSSLGNTGDTGSSSPTTTTQPSTTDTTQPSTTDTTTVQSAVAAWYATNGNVVVALQNDVTDFDNLLLVSPGAVAQGQAVCKTMATDASAAKAVSPIPDPSVESTWSAAISDLLSGAQEELQDIGADTSTEGAEATIEAGAIDLDSVALSVGADAND